MTGVSGVAICSPLFWGGGSGASSYYRLLAKGLASSGCTVSVISDSEAARRDIVVGYFPLFPARCSRDRRPLHDKVAYLKQNLAYLQIEGILRRTAPGGVLVHSSFYNHPGIFAAVMKRTMKRLPEMNFVADVRDAMMPLHKVPLLNGYRRVIACSENVAEHLLAGGVAPERIARVPVMQERLDVDAAMIQRLAGELALVGRPYIFYAGLVKEDKAVGLLLEAFLKHVRPARPDLLLVIAGLMKTSSRYIRGMLAEEGVRYAGNRSRDEVLALMSDAALCANLSPNEGMPRSSLEALALGRPVALPPNVPEFAKYCGNSVVAERSPSVVAVRLLEVMDAGPTVGYPIERHYPEAVLPVYRELLSV